MLARFINLFFFYFSLELETCSKNIVQNKNYALGLGAAAGALGAAAGAA